MPRVAAPNRTAFAFELQQMRENRLARNLQQALLEPAIDLRYQRIGRGIAMAEGGQNLLLTLTAMLEICAQHVVGLVNRGTVRREQPQRPKRSHALERGQIVSQVALQVRRDVYRRSLDGEVAGEQHARLLVPEAEMVRCMPGRMHSLQPIVAGLHELTIAERLPPDGPPAVAIGPRHL